MKKKLVNILSAVILISSLSSCATLFGGSVNTAQRTKPLPGEPARKVRAVALIADVILFWPSLIVDFATGAIYKPEGNGVTTAAEAKPVTTKAEKSI